MNQKKYFQQLRKELEASSYKERFLKELEDHAQDLIAMEPLNEDLPIPDFIMKRMGEPKMVKENFNSIMNPWREIQTLALYAFSLFSLYFAWHFLINMTLSAWEHFSDHRDLSPVRQKIMDFFQNGGSEMFVYVLLIISLLIVALRLKRKGSPFLFQILDYAAISNFFYLGLLIALSFFYHLIHPNDVSADLDFFGIVLNVTGILLLFYIQIKGFMVNLNPHYKSQKKRP